MAKSQVLRWPSMLTGLKSCKFRAWAETVLHNQKLATVVVGQNEDWIYIRPCPSKVGVFSEMITRWHEICYDKYRERNFDPVDEVTITFLYNGTIYRGMFPLFNKPCENGFFQFKLTGTFVV